MKNIKVKLEKIDSTHNLESEERLRQDSYNSENKKNKIVDLSPCPTIIKIDPATPSEEFNTKLGRIKDM